MSYDLYFGGGNSSKPLTLETFAEYFDRPWYTVEDGIAAYQNSDTGVEFQFQMLERDEDGEDESVASFSLNYFRPSYTPLEAEPEIRAFGRHFDLGIFDPHVEDAEEYDLRQFVDNWLAFNKMSIDQMKELSEVPSPSLPRDALHAAWRWNLTRGERQQQIGENKFLPAIQFWEVDGGLKTVCVWFDGASCILPHVDCVMVGRHALAPKPKAESDEPDSILLDWEDLTAVVIPFGKRLEDGAIDLDYPETPEDLKNYIRSLKKVARDIQGFAPGDVIDAELLER